jgi:hypothetical protein
MTVTFLAGLVLGLDYGMLIGVGVNLMFILYNSARPKVHVRNLTVSKLLVRYELHNVSKNVSPNQIFPHGSTVYSGPRPPYYRGFTITLRYTTLRRTPLDE